MKTNATASSSPPNEAPAGGKVMGQPQTNLAAEREIVKFCLYVADHLPNSGLARANLSALCALHFPDHHEIEIVDVCLAPERAREDSIIMVPTLVKMTPLPMRKIVGPLRDAEVVLVELGLARDTA